MTVFIYDVESFKHDWIVVMKELNKDVWYTFHNKYGYLNDLLENEDNIYIGFNSKHYDRYIIQAIYTHNTPSEIKSLSDFIINNDIGIPVWEHPLIQGTYFKFNNVDIRDDMQQGLSLKSIEAHLGEPIVESTIDFNIDRKLTDDEVEETIKYCMNDVLMTEKIVNLRENYLSTKETLGEMQGSTKEQSLRLTNAKITSKYLNAQAISTDDERQYVYPKTLNMKYIPKDVTDFFGKLEDLSIPDYEIFSSSLDIQVKNTPVKIAYGGIHGAIKKYKETATDNRVIINLDVASYYPNIMVKLGYISRALSDPKLYEKILNERLQAKKQGDTLTAGTLKLVLNTKYGAMLNKYNDLYDPLMARSVCISGQLYLLWLANELIEKIESIELIQINTDGLMVSLDVKDILDLYIISGTWEKITGFELEEDRIQKVIQKDVNNYLIIMENGKIKTKGGYLVRGIQPFGAFNINNNYPIVSKALIDKFTKNIPLEETIDNSDNILDFQIIAKAGSTYKDVFHEVYGEMQKLTQRVNRVYATKDINLGKLYKLKGESMQKIANLPEHCIIDNFNELDIKMVDRDYYLELAKKRYKEFLGENYDGNKNKN